MYEPKYLPELNEASVILQNLRFTVECFDGYKHQNDPNADPLHIHRYLEIFLNISSDVSFLVNNNLYTVAAGCAVVSPPESIHVATFNKSALQEHLCIWIDADFSSPLFSFLRDEDFCPLFSFDEQTGDKLRSLAFSLIEACKKDEAELEKACCLIRILTILKNKRLSAAEENFIPGPLQKILDDIHENYSEIHTVNDILAEHFISSATLTRWFRKYIHTTPKEYLESVKLSGAAAMLSAGASATEACMRSGFSDLSHFIVLFKKKFGQTPLQYKKTAK